MSEKVREMPKEPLHEFIRRVESEYFRTDQDTGANEYAMLVWNRVRQHAGLSRLRKEDLPSFCDCCRRYHVGAAKIPKIVD